MEAPSGIQTLPGAVTVRCGKPRRSGSRCEARLFEVYYFPSGPLVRANPEVAEHVGLYIGPGQMKPSDQRWKLKHRCWPGKPIVTYGFVCSISHHARDRGKSATDLVA